MRPGRPAPALIKYRLWRVGTYPVLADSEPDQKFRVGFGPRTPAPGPITFRLRLGGTHPVLEDSDGVGFETICYYLIINTIKDLYCAFLREIATTCDFAVTNCHEIYFPHFQCKILRVSPSPFETKLILNPSGGRALKPQNTAP